MPINKKKQDSSAFDSSYKSLNAKQKEAVDTIEGPVVVIAGPGTGKTTILTLRIANILRLTDTAPENILAMTFTESGAHAMRRKLTEIIGPAAYKVNIHTFHGFAAHVIEQYPDYFPGIIGSTIITELEKVKIIEEILKSDKVKLLRPYGDQAYYIGPILREIQILKRENVSPKQLMDDQNLVMGSLLGMESAGVNELKSSSKGSKSSNAKSKAVGIGSRSSTIKQEAVSSHQTINGKGSDNLKKTDIDRLKKQTEKNLELAFVYDSYEKKLAKKKYYDFEDMLLRLIQAMEEDKNFKLMLQESYHYILADEHQDANASQNRILELLADFHDSPNLFIVGDDKQAIYRFQGASLDNFLYFSKKYRDAVVIDLEHNYRSHQGILDASHSLISKNPTIPGYERKKLLSLQMGSMPILITECSTVNDELELVARAIERLLSKNILGHEIAVLYRDNKHAKPLSDVLRSHGIAHKIESDNDLLRELDVAKIIMLCKAMHDPSDNEALASALFLKELRCDPVEVAALCNLASRERKPLFESIMRSVGSDIKVAYQRIINWSQESRIIPFANFLQRLIQEMWILSSIVADPDSLERLNTLQAFFDHIASAAQSKRSFYLDDFIEYIDLAREHGLNGKPDHSERVGGVRLMTAHRAKGLEFSHVFIIHVVDGIWGNRSARNLFTIPLIEHARNTGRIEDERRLLYVAMTRARDSVHVTYSRNNGEKDLLPSQFMSEIDPALVDFDRMDDSDSDFLTHPIFQIHRLKTDISILQPDFIRAKFLAQPLSVTHLNNYLKCPWTYFFVNLIRVPQAQNKHQAYGTAIHLTLRAYFDSLKEERDLNTKKVLALFKHHIEMQPLSLDERKESLEKGDKALKGYLKAYDSTWNRRILTEYSIKGITLGVNFQFSNSNFQSGGSNIPHEIKNDEISLQLTGKIDKIEFLDEQNVVVVDYKTSKPKSRNAIEGKTAEVDGNYKRQLVFYKLLLDLDEKFNMKHGEIDFIEPNERGLYKKERFEIEESEIRQLKGAIAKMASEVLNLSFIHSDCGEKDCQYCALGKLLVRGGMKKSEDSGGESISGV